MYMFQDERQRQGQNVLLVDERQKQVSCLTIFFDFILITPLMKRKKLRPETMTHDR